MVGHGTSWRVGHGHGHESHDLFIDRSLAILKWSLCYKFSIRLMNEFNKQNKLENDNNLPITIKGLNINNPLSIGKMQLSYVDYVVKPLWNHTIIIIPELKHRMDELEINRINWNSG